MNWPKITVVTPSYNQGQFLEETIVSVVGQQYPNLEYIIIDGGSTDNSVEIIKRYQKHLTFWVSEKDSGQSAAINKGFNVASGDILAWLNSDDMYLPGTLPSVARKLNLGQPEIIFGNCLHFVQHRPITFGSDVERDHESLDLVLADYIIQPSSFWTKESWLTTGALDESLNFGLDWDWFIRAKKAGIVFRPETKYLSLYRIHPAHKTGVGGATREKELVSIYERHAGHQFATLFSRCCSHRAKILFLKDWIRRVRLTKFEMSILKHLFPNLFYGFKPDEIRAIVRMIMI
jgi:glycosyltransferase involved in cell wall biosynthesis